LLRDPTDQNEVYATLPASCSLGNFDVPDIYALKEAYYSTLSSVLQIISESNVAIGPKGVGVSSSTADLFVALELERNNWFQKLHELLWNSTVITKVLKTAFQVSAFLDQGQSVLINSRVAQLVCILVRIINDPYVREIQGFYQLLEHKWIPELLLSDNRNITNRGGSAFSSGDKTAPFLLILLLNCVQVLIIHNPSAFEFNDKYLLMFVDEFFLSR